MALKDRLRRLQQKAEEGSVLIRQRDGSVRAFDTMEVQAQMFLARMDLFRKNLIDSEVLGAVRNATPESKAAFEERFGPISITNHVIASGQEGAWIETYTLHEDGVVKKTLHEGGSEEAERIRREIQERGAS